MLHVVVQLAGLSLVQFRSCIVREHGPGYLIELDLLADLLKLELVDEEIDS